MGTFINGDCLKEEGENLFYENGNQREDKFGFYFLICEDMVALMDSHSWSTKGGVSYSLLSSRSTGLG